MPTSFNDDGHKHDDDEGWKAQQNAQETSDGRLLGIWYVFFLLSFLFFMLLTFFIRCPTCSPTYTTGFNDDGHEHDDGEGRWRDERRNRTNAQEMYNISWASTSANLGPAIDHYVMVYSAIVP
jgi:hypothetical protein